jgi:hypothetical protein
MDMSPLSQWLGGPYQILLKEPAGEQVVGILRNLVPEQHLTLERGDDTYNPPSSNIRTIADVA